MLLRCKAAIMMGKWFKRDKPQQPSIWPELPIDGFIAGRSAKVGDVDRGNAVFSQRADDGVPAEPFPTIVPQYALWHDEKGSDIPAIIVQAERHITDPEGTPVFGLRCLDGTAIVAFGDEVRLLGADKPNP